MESLNLPVPKEMLAQTLLHAAGEGTSSDSCHTGMGGLAAQGRSITHLPTVLQETFTC